MSQPKENLMNKRIIELKEMLEREDKLLANKKFINKLKDKGEKIRIKRNEIERIIKIKESVEETESFLAKLSLGDKQHQILPKHPMFTASKDDIKLAKQSINNQKDGKEVIKDIINGELDIFSVAISRTFDNELSQKTSERFVLNKINKNLNKKSKNNETKLTNKIDSNQQNKDNESKISSNQELQSSSNQELQSSSNQNQELSNQDKILSNSNEQSDKLSQSTIDKKELIYNKYKNTALEPLEDKSKLISLSIESSLEFGKEQKVKDYEVEKLRLEKRLTWRKIIEFDTDESESNSEESEDDYLDDD